MKIRWKLTLQFAAMVAAILLIFSAAIYAISSYYRQKQFYSRLKERAENSMKLLLEVREVDSVLLKIIDRNTQGLVEERIVIFNESDHELYDNGVEDTSMFQEGFLRRIREKGTLEFRQDEREGYARTFILNGNQNVVIASAYDKFGTDKLKNLQLILLIAFISGVTLAVIGGATYASAALRPISSVIDQVNRISASNLHLRVDEGNKSDEIAQLAMTFNQMLTRLESSFEMQRSFAYNISHELRTPLTYILGEMEIMEMSGKEVEEYRKFLNVMSCDIREVSRMLDNLLNLAQASMDVSNIKFAPVRLDELLLLSRIDLLKTHPEYEVVINFENFPEDLEEMTFRSNEQLLKIAFLNLMDNACKFSGNHHVDVVLGTQEKEFRITFSDSGIGIPGVDLANLLKQPFYRGANAMEKKGSGIGLTLTSKIIALHGGTLGIRSEQNVGSTFTIQLPKRPVT